MNLDCLSFPIGETGLVIASPSWTAAGLKQCEWRVVRAACDVGKHCLQSAGAHVLVIRPPGTVECLELKWKLKYASEPHKFQIFFFFFAKSM